MINWKRVVNVLGLLALSVGLIGIDINTVAAQQNLTVRPMKVEADVPPNRTGRIMLTVRNHHATQTETVRLEVVDLTQRLDGGLTIVEEEGREALDEFMRQASSRDWILLPPEEIVVEPEGTAEIPVLLRVPADARGAYVSAVRILTEAPDASANAGADQAGVFSVGFGFLIPMLTHIEGRPVRLDIDLADVSMNFDDGRDPEGNVVREPTTQAVLKIANRGRTHSSVQGTIRVERQTGENWRLVTRAEIARRSILPGATLELAEDLQRRLPSGAYRLIGSVAVDGRPLPRMEREIDFDGDPDTDSVAFDTTLRLEPSTVQLSVVPGATRTSTVTVTNPSDQPVSVQVRAQTPASLQGVAMGELMGEDLSAAQWSQIRPDRFTIRPRGSRNVRVMSRMPRDGVDRANYYADIILDGRYEDGQNAGQTRSMLLLRHEEMDPVVNASIGGVSVALDEEPSTVVIQSRVTNTGDVHFEPGARADLIDTGGNVTERWQLTGASGALLPLDVRDFSATVDLESVEAGEYLLRITSLQEGARIDENSRPVRIELVGDGERELIVLEN